MYVLHDVLRKDLLRQNSSRVQYFYWLNSFEIIDATNEGNIARFVNHACDPNCTANAFRIGRVTRVGIFAVV